MSAGIYGAIRRTIRVGGELWRTRHPNFGSDSPREANFEGQTVTDCDFTGVTFGLVNFKGATFTERAIFRDAKFTEAADFEGATFTQAADFRRAKFTGEVNFVNAEMKAETHFGDASFTSSPPRFFGAKLHEGTVWTNVIWPEPPKDPSEAGQFVYAYERLKLEMDRLKKHGDELDFFAREQQCRRIPSSSQTTQPSPSRTAASVRGSQPENNDISPFDPEIDECSRLIIASGAGMQNEGTVSSISLGEDSLDNGNGSGSRYGNTVTSYVKTAKSRESHQ